MTSDASWVQLASSADFALARRPALGTTIDLALFPPAGLELAQAAVDALLQKLDRAASRFRWDSEISELNRSPATPQRMSPLLTELISVALEAARSTDGLVDPTLGAPLIEAGYSDDYARLPGHQAASRGARQVAWSWRTVELQADTLTLPRGLQLDLGATAKAWGADRAAAEIVALTGGSALVSFGGDLTTAGPVPSGGWVVRVADGHHAGSGGLGQNVKLASRALATSSTTQRRWTKGGHDMHHIIDPRTGRPSAGPWRTISVAAPSCVAANVASTAAIVLGVEAPGWLELRGWPARLVSIVGTALHLGGWPSDGDEMPPFAGPLRPHAEAH